MNGEIRIEYVPLGSVARWPRNPKLHDHDALGASVDRFGFVQPLLVDERTGQLVAGHGRLETLQKRKAEGKPPPGRVTVGADGEWMVPVIRGVAFGSEAEAEAYLLADNRLVEIGGWNNDVLIAMLDAARMDPTALLGTGFSSAEVEHLITAQAMLHPPPPAEPPEYDEDIAADVPMLECPACHHQWPKK